MEEIEPISGTIAGDTGLDKGQESWESQQLKTQWEKTLLQGEAGKGSGTWGRVEVLKQSNTATAASGTAPLLGRSIKAPVMTQHIHPMLE